MQRNTKLLTFFPKIADAFIGARSYDNLTGPKKHEHSPEIKTNCYFWASINWSSYVFSSNSFI